MIGKIVKVTAQWYNSFLEKGDICKVVGKEDGYKDIYWLERISDTLEQPMPLLYFEEVEK